MAPDPWAAPGLPLCTAVPSARGPEICWLTSSSAARSCERPLPTHRPRQEALATPLVGGRAGRPKESPTYSASSPGPRGQVPSPLHPTRGDLLITLPPGPPQPPVEPRLWSRHGRGRRARPGRCSGEGGVALVLKTEIVGVSLGGCFGAQAICGRHPEPRPAGTQSLTAPAAPSEAARPVPAQPVTPSCPVSIACRKLRPRRVKGTPRTCRHRRKERFIQHVANPEQVVSNRRGGRFAPGRCGWCPPHCPGKVKRAGADPLARASPSCGLGSVFRLCPRGRLQSNLRTGSWRCAWSALGSQDSG